jgi:hypothetical protein
VSQVIRFPPDGYEWEVWLADGTIRSSVGHEWDDVPDGVLVLRWWGPRGKGVTWGDAIYGHPATHKQAGYVSDATFARVLAEALATTLPPGAR